MQLIQHIAHMLVLKQVTNIKNGIFDIYPIFYKLSIESYSFYV